MSVAVIGYGAVGRHATKSLIAHGYPVRILQRRRPVLLPQDAEYVEADVLDPQGLRRACGGAEALVCCIGFPYDSRIWQELWPRAMESMLTVCAGLGARFVFADNLYMLGPQTAPLTEDMPLTDYGRKPRLRAEITRQWLDAYRAGRVEGVAVRASDFYGPRVETSVLAHDVVRRLMQGQKALIVQDMNSPHDFTYVPDFARALVTLLEAPADCYGQAWNVPNAPTQTLRQLIHLAAKMIGVAPRISAPPHWALKGLGLFDRRLLELEEMRFQTDRPYRVDSSKFLQRFGGRATSFTSGLVATIAANARTELAASHKIGF